MPKTPNILLVDDEPRVTIILEGELLDHEFDVVATNSSVEAIELLGAQQFDLVITDLSMPDKSGLDVLRAARAERSVPVILMTAHATLESAVEAGRMGVTQYIEKPFANAELVELVKRTLSLAELSGSAERLSDEGAEEFKALAQGVVFGKAPAAQKMNELIKKVAPSDATVLLTGASGSGKEVAARLLHQLSGRRDKPFVAVNCAAIAETLLESELFGHVKGAFTGASDLKRGKFELADSGVIFLDEIGETSGALQTKLLRALEERTFTRVGDSEEITVDVRVIAATNRNLQKEISAGNFREDLFFRLNVFPIEVPALKERKEDLPEFVRFFLAANGRAYDSITDSALVALTAHNWPGNIRELRNTIERACILAGSESITPEHLDLQVSAGGAVVDSESAAPSLAENEKQMIENALTECAGNKTEAAKKLGITRRRLYSRMKILGIGDSD